MKIKASIERILIFVSTLYVLCFVTVLIIASKDIDRANWGSALVLTMGPPIGMWFVFFAVTWIIAGIKQKKFWPFLKVAIMTLVLVVVLQITASILLLKLGYGSGPVFECSLCQASSHQIKGAALPEHYLYIPLPITIKTGRPDCQHQWIQTGERHLNGIMHPMYLPLIKISFWLFWVAVASLAAAAGCIVFRKKSDVQTAKR
mgnify:CR=1 FL=1